MTKIRFLLMALLINFTTFAQKEVHIIPEPAVLDFGSGYFLWQKSIELNLQGINSTQTKWFIDFAERSTGVHFTNSKNLSAKKLQLKIDTSLRSIPSNGGYIFDVSPTKINITARDETGIFYGLQSLIQLLPASTLAPGKHTITCQIPSLHITDYPSFAWRGLMLDVSRHFFTKKEVLAFIDQMSHYKFNVFHWHLTDDNGWRIEIKSLPKLTQIGAYRVTRTGKWHNQSRAKTGEKADDGGYYTQEEIKEVVKYAQDRHISILPEIDVPGHSLAMIASYPNLSCTKEHYDVDPGSVIRKVLDNALCVSNDSVYIVLDKVFTEVAQLFPNPYIHIGGDEAYKGFWEKHPECVAFMKSHNMKNSEELQSYFIKRLEKILQSKGKKLIGWDEILEGGISPDATVMSWRGMSGGIEAVKQKHHVIMTPWDYVYLDLYQGDSLNEPLTYGRCTLTTSYGYDPIPDSIDGTYILGGQGNLWTESVPHFRQVEYMTWPRALALSEVYWSPKKKKNWNRFIHTIPYQFERLDSAGINHANSIYDVTFHPSKDDQDSLIVEMDTEFPGMDIYYTFDNTFPDKYSKKYKSGEKISFPKDADQLIVVSYLDGKPKGKMTSIYKKELIRRRNIPRHIY